jgi:hypothetical protein
MHRRLTSREVNLVNAIHVSQPPVAIRALAKGWAEKEATLLIMLREAEAKLRTRKG